MRSLLLCGDTSMPFFQNLVFATALIGLPVVAFLQCFTESVFVLNPLIDTALPKGFSVERFDKIKPGMTQQQVRELVPPPPSIYESAWAYGNDGAAPFGDYAWFMFEIEFDAQGRVVKTSRHTFYD